MKKRTYDCEISFISENEWGHKIIVEAGFELVKDSDENNKSSYHLIKLKAISYAHHTPYELSKDEDEALTEEAYQELSKELAA